jgi:hypothetical protein
MHKQVKATNPLGKQAEIEYRNYKLSTDQRKDLTHEDKEKIAHKEILTGLQRFNKRYAKKS